MLFSTIFHVFVNILIPDKSGSQMVDKYSSHFQAVIEYVTLVTIWILNTGTA